MRIPALFLLAGLAACSRGEAKSSLGRVVVDTVGGKPRIMTEVATGWADTNGWKLVEEARILGGTDDPGEVIEPQDVTIGSNGHIYLSDNNPSVIKEYDPHGKLIRTIGREGQGPGEFQAAFIFARGADLFVHDPRNRRTNLFDTAGAFVRSWPSVCCYFGPIPMDSAGNVGVSTMAQHIGESDAHQPYDHLVRWYSRDSTLVDTTLVPSGPEVKRWTLTAGSGKNKSMMRTGIPWTADQVELFLPDRSLVIGFGGAYTIAITDRKGTDTLALFGRSWTPLPIPDATRNAEVERRITETAKFWDATLVRNAFALSDVPATAPAFDWIALDGRGDLWVRTPLPADTMRTLFDVFDPEHRWLGQVAGTGLLRSWGVKLTGDKMVAYGEDGEGNPVVVVYKIVRGGDEPIS